MWRFGGRFEGPHAVVRGSLVEVQDATDAERLGLGDDRTLTGMRVRSIQLSYRWGLSPLAPTKPTTPSRADGW